MNCQGRLGQLLTLYSGISWEEVLPPLMPECQQSECSTPITHALVVAGRQSSIGTSIARVEVFNIGTLQWSTASSLPKAEGHPHSQMTTCGGCIYLASSDNKVFSCSVEDLKSDSVWTELANIPTPWWSTKKTCAGYWRRRW